MKNIRKLIQNILVEHTMKSELFELATERKDLRRDIISAEPQITKHLIYLRLYPNSGAINHWKTEICAFTEPFRDKLVKGNKKPPYDLYFDYLYNESYENSNGDYFESKYKNANKKEGQPRVKLNQINVVEFDNQLKKFYMDMAKLFSSKKYIMDEEVIELLDKWIELPL